MKKMTIQLTSDQQKQVKEATGKDLTDVHLDLPDEQLSEQELGNVQGGSFQWGVGHGGSSTGGQVGEYITSHSIGGGSQGTPKS